MDKDKHKTFMYPWQKRGAVTTDYMNQTQYYYLSKYDIEVIQKWIPKATITCPYVNEIEGILIGKCNISPDQTPKMSWPQILETLKQTHLPIQETPKDIFLDDLISEIDSLIQQEGFLEKVQVQFEKFCLMVENYGCELESYCQIAKKKYYEFADNDTECLKLCEDLDKLSSFEKTDRFSKVSKLYINHCQNSPTENPTWVLHSCISDYIAEENWATKSPIVYRPPLLEMPSNPVFWFLKEMDRYLNEYDPVRQPDKDERLMCDYVRMAVIHDESCTYTKPIMIYKDTKYEGLFKRDTFTKDLWETYKSPKTEEYKKTHDRALKQALANIKNDLSENADEKEQGEMEKLKRIGRNESVFLLMSSKEIWGVIEKEYGVSKKQFGKKMNFVKDKSKRDFIFRDVEHAFVLAFNEFSKPALILAGGVIEELLRIYLQHKNIKPNSKTFSGYIKTCDDNNLLKQGVSRLSDSLRDFRNYVHLAKEEEKKHSITKAAAKGAVASIFTIANGF